MNLVVGLAGMARNACVAVCTPDGMRGICEQERITRVRGAGFNQTGLPDEALDELLHRAGRRRDDVTTYVLAGDAPLPRDIECERLDGHFAHACSAFLPSGFESAAVVVCDIEAPEVSVWSGRDRTVTTVEWPWRGQGFARLYSECAQAFGFIATGQEQRLEALARVDPAKRDARVTRLFTFDKDELRSAPHWQADLDAWVGGLDWCDRASMAGAVQCRIGDLLVDFLGELRRQLPHERRLCVAGSLFTNSYFNSLVKRSEAFDDVFVPVNPGGAGAAVGAALHASGPVRLPADPFCGPSYSAEEVKATLDNCKLTYRWVSQGERLDIVVTALQRGQLVAWFDGPMEWGPRALGARSILASPFAPYVLENLNRFLKRRDVWRGYALSGLDSAVRDHFDGPTASPFMECDYTPKDRGPFRQILPGPNAAVRIQTVGPGAPQSFGALLEAFGDASGMPILVNTSFNGFREPIVCSPNDAVRVFYGSGLDLLIAGDFVISK